MADIEAEAPSESSTATVKDHPSSTTEDARSESAAPIDTAPADGDAKEDALTDGAATAPVDLAAMEGATTHATDDAPADGAAKGDAPADAAAKKEAAPKAGAKPWSPIGAVSLRTGIALSVGSGLLYFLGFPGIDIWPLSFIALTPLIIAMRGQPTRRTTLFGWLAGFTMTMTGFYWLLPMLKVFSGFGTPLCAVFMAILCGYQGGRIGLAGWLYGRAATRGWPAAPVFALAFAVSELVYPLLFPWYFGASVHNAPVFMQVADLGGPILVGLVLVASNLALAEIVSARREGRSIDKRLVRIGAAVPVIAALYGLLRMWMTDRTMQSASRITVGIVQPNLRLFDRRESVMTHLDLTRKLREQHADLVIFSEAGLAKTWAEPRYKDELRGFARGLGVPTIIGTLLVRPGAMNPETGRPDNQWFNTAVLADKDGTILGRYDKQFLLTFGEYIPFGDTFPVLYKMSPNSSHFSKGDSIEPLVWGDHRISTMICYEDILPSFVNKMVSSANPDLLVNMTNDAWFGDSTEPWIHLALAKLRAVEHRRYLVRATNSGVSAIVDANGRVTMHTATFDAEAAVGEIRFLRARTGYEILGDAPWWIAALAIGFMAVRSRARGKPAR
jgi:apolipoprotein N-acyltransferase